MKINNIVVTFWFNKILDIKSKINYFEKELSEYFHGINSIGVSADVNPNYPRLTALSDGGHTKLTVSMINAQIAINYDSKMSSDYDKCFEYLNHRILKVYNLFKEILNIDILYGAVLILCEVEEENPMNLIKSKLLSENLDGNYCETGVRISEIIDNKYYKNLSYNTTKFITVNKKSDTNQNEIILPLLSLTNTFVEKEGIAISYEINDKYLFDTKENYALKLEDLNIMLNIAKNDVINEIKKKLDK